MALGVGKVEKGFGEKRGFEEGGGDGGKCGGGDLFCGELLESWVVLKGE